MRGASSAISRIMTSSPRIEREGKLSKTRTASSLSRLRAWADVLQAAGNLAWARWKVGSTEPSALLKPAGSTFHPLSASDRDELVKRVATAMPRAASRVPWRSDCLVQALAAERWLGRYGVAADLCIGARKDEHSQFHAHAWLKVGDVVVTGGDIRAYSPLIHGAEPRLERD